MQEDDDMIVTLLEHLLKVLHFTPLSRDEAHARLRTGKTSEVRRQKMGQPQVSEQRSSPSNEDCR